ncbi:MAG: hypothetical protein WCI55_12210 [Armatimonadota bacterium]
MDVKTIVLYVVIVLILLWCVRSERQDISCSGNDCGSSKGKAYYHAHPEKGDKRTELLVKLLKTARYDLITVHWRRIMIVSIISPPIAILVAEGRWPPARTLAIAIIVGFLIGYAFQIHFQTSVVRPALAQADQIAKLMRK